MKKVMMFDFWNYTIKGTRVFSFSNITLSGGSQLPCYKDPEGNQWRGLCFVKMRFPVNSQHILANYVNAPSWKQSLLSVMPYVPDQMTAALVNIFTETN